MADYGQWREAGWAAWKHGLPGRGREAGEEEEEKGGNATSFLRGSASPTTFLPSVALGLLSSSCLNLPFSFDLWPFSCSVSAFSDPGKDLCARPLYWRLCDS